MRTAPALFAAFFSALVLAVVATGFQVKQVKRVMPCVGECVPKAELVKERKRSQRRLLGWRRMERDRNRWKRVTLAKGSVSEALNLAGAVYGNGSTLWRKARCETGGTFSPYSLNSSSGASGLLQFLPSTWRSTPFARFSVWSPYANALAAGWMHSVGRGGEWSCR